MSSKPMSSTDLPTAVASAVTAHSIPCISPSQPEFESLRQQYVPTSSLPSHIIRPQSAEEVAALVGALAEAAAPFTVRAGGHDLQCRSTAHGVVQLDLRRMNTVTISPDRKSARIGGGAIFRDVLGVLEPAGLTAPVGNCGGVGYVGWSTFGGYGPYVGKYGLGTDGIVGARVVLPDGSLVDAGKGLLKCLRGGGPSNWGVVVELEIEVHELQEIQAGMFLYDTTDAGSSVKQVLTNFAALLEAEALPPHLLAEPTFFKLPTRIQFAIIYVWNGDSSPESKSWEEKFAGLGPCILKAVKPTTPQGVMAASDASLPEQLPLHCETVSLKNLSAETIAAIAEAAVASVSNPNTALGAGVVIHSLLSPSPSIGARENSTFLCREPHFMLELHGISMSPEASAEAADWARGLQAKLRSTSDNLESTYSPFTTEKGAEWKVYGKHLDHLSAMKKELDPKGLMKHAFPKLFS